MDQQTLSRYPAGSLARVGQIIGNPAKGVPALLPISWKTFLQLGEAGIVPQGTKLAGTNVRAWPIEVFVGVAGRGQVTSNLEADRG